MFYEVTLCITEQVKALVFGLVYVVKQSFVVIDHSEFVNAYSDVLCALRRLDGVSPVMVNVLLSCSYDEPKPIVSLFRLIVLIVVVFKLDILLFHILY